MNRRTAQKFLLLTTFKVAVCTMNTYDLIRILIRYLIHDTMIPVGHRGATIHHTVLYSVRTLYSVSYVCLCTVLCVRMLMI